MSHSDTPKDSCGGARRCGGNLLASTAAEARRESALARNVRTATEIFAGFRSAAMLRKGR
ncbi:hypothetical protein ACIBF1_42595 [Spirillospora sp. NPDC050679]